MHYTSKEVYEYISQQTNDPIVERKTCTVSGAQFPIYQSDLDFYDKISPVINGVKYQIPSPKLCPEERERQRLMFRNERHLYKNTCKATGKAIISHHDSDAPFPVYEQSYWWSDARDAQNYALTFEDGKSIMQHLKELSDQVPRFNLYSLNVENCSYSNYIGNSKSCYLTYASTNCEHLIYSRAGAKSSSCCDVFFAEDCHECYEIIKCQNCSKVKHAILCENCYDCEYIVGCNGCSFCYHCSDLTNQSYCIDNKPYSPEEWKIEVEKRRKLNQTSYPHSEKLQQSNNLSIENSYGSFLTECRNVAFCHGMSRAENCKYMRDEIDTQDNQDVYGAMLSSQCYQSISTVQSSHVLFSSYIGRSKDLIYCSYCYDCENCFGCIGLKNKQYCIFNKQYSQEEYRIILAQLLSQAQKEGIR